MPNMGTLYQNERNGRLARFGSSYPLPGEEFSFDVRVEVEQRHVMRSIQRLLVEYKNAHRGPTIILIQTQKGGCGFIVCHILVPDMTTDVDVLRQSIPALDQFPTSLIPSLERCHTSPHSNMWLSLIHVVTVCTLYLIGSDRLLGD